MTLHKQRQRRRAEGFKGTLKAQGLLTHSFDTKDKPKNPSDKTIRRRISYVKHNIEHHDSTVGDAIEFVSLFTKHHVRNNKEARELIANDLNKIYIREQNLLNRKLDHDWDTLVKVVFGGLIQGFSERDHAKINHFVCLFVSLHGARVYSIA